MFQIYVRRNLSILAHSSCSNVSVVSPQRWRLTFNWVSKLEQRFDERTLNSVFWVSAKTTILAVFPENRSLFTALLLFKTDFREWSFAEYFYLFGGKQNIFLPISRAKYVVKSPAKCLKIGWWIKILFPQIFLNREFCMGKWQVVEVTIFSEIFFKFQIFYRKCLTSL